MIRSIVSRRMHDREYEDLSLEQQAEVSMKVDQFTIRENESLPNNLLMIVNTKNIPESLEIVREITQEINRSLQTRNKSAIDTLVDSAIAKKNLDVRNAETRMDALSQNFLRIHSMRLARLEEMARIARSLNIEEALRSDSEGASQVEPITQLLPSRFGNKRRLGPSDLLSKRVQGDRRGNQCHQGARPGQTLPLRYADIGYYKQKRSPCR